MRTIRVTGRLLLVLSLVCALTLASLAAPPTGITAPKIAYEKFTLKNGLDVILVEDHRLPMVAVNLWYHVGPANEKPGRTGFAHLFEHMMFQGSANVPEKNPFKVLEAAGASDINGTTDFDRTNYFETLPANQLELALWLESDRMGFLLQKLDEPKLANQRDVVRNERRQSVENQPYGLADEAVFHELFPKGHPYYPSVIGSHADIEAARLQDVRDFFKMYYAPNNASLAIVGDIDKAQARALVDKYFGPIPAGPPVPKIDVKTPPITAERRAVVTDKVELPKVYMAWVTDPIFQPGDAGEQVLARILGGGKSSRLYKSLVYEKQIAQDVTAYQYPLMLGSVFGIEATAKPGTTPEQLEAAIQEELDKIQKEAPSQAEVDRARNKIETQIVQRLETLGGFGGVADRLNMYNHFLKDPGYLPKDIARYNAITPAAVHRIAQAKLQKDARVVVYCVPGEKKIEDVPQTKDEPKLEISTAVDPSQQWRKEQPKPAAARVFTLPAPETFRLANGLKVMVVERHELPVVSASVVTLTGSDANPPERPGLAAFTAAMLSEGTATRSALQIADDVDQIGATLNTGSSADNSYTGIRVLKNNTDAAFALLSDVTLHPAFDAKEIERLRKQRLTALLQQNDNPNALATRVFYHVLYGDKHPYGFIELGTTASVKAITRDDLMSFWKRGYVPESSALVIAGDVTLAEARTLAEKYFGSWQGKGEKIALPEVAGGATRRIVIVDKPGAPQTQLRVGEIGIARSNPDYVPVEVMNMMLGGTFSSRINMNLREEHGYTYGAFSRFLSRRAPGPFVAGSGVRTDATAPAVREIFNELNRMRATDLTPDELALARDSLARSLPGRFETTPEAAASIAEIFVYGLPNDYFQTLPAKVDAVSAAEVRRVAERYLTPEAMTVVVVGDRAKIEPELKTLDLGPVEVRDAEGNVVKP